MSPQKSVTLHLAAALALALFTIVQPTRGHAQEDSERDPAGGGFNIAVGNTGVSFGNSSRFNGLRINWSDEYLDLIMGVKVVSNLDEAIQHINTYSSAHTDAIVTADESNARQFLHEVDSASVLWNASPRMADGGQVGLGAEIGISTDKFHARGPVGLEGLTSVKFVVLGDGHVRQ